MNANNLSDFIQIPGTGLFLRTSAILAVAISESTGKMSIEYGVYGAIKNVVLLPSDAIGFLEQNFPQNICLSIKSEILKNTWRHLEVLFDKEMQATLMELRATSEDAFLVVSPVSTYLHEKYVLLAKNNLSEKENFKVEVQTWAETLHLSTNNSK